MKKRVNAKTPTGALFPSAGKQTNLSAWRTSTPQSTGSKKAQTPSGDQQSAAEELGQSPLEEALDYLEKIKDRTSLKNKVLQQYLVTVEKTAQERGLAPEEIDILLNIALSGKFAEAISTRLVKNLIPTSLIKEDSVVSAVSWLCVSKCSRNTQVLFLKWLIAMFDFIDRKEQINSLYGFFFSFLQDEKLHPFVCHVLYLLTRRENVKPFRVRRLLDLQTRMGTEPPLQALLLMYKNFAPEMVSITLPANTKIRFKNSENLWKTALGHMKQRMYGPSPASQQNLIGMDCPQSRKRKWNTQVALSARSTTSSRGSAADQKASCADPLGCAEAFPVEQLQTFPQLLQNIHRLELPSRIGSVLRNPLLLHHINCLRDDSVYQRMYFWMGQTFREECPWYKTENQQYELEFKDFLERVFEAECFLQEGFSSCEEFLYRSLPFWDGCCCRAQVLQLVSWIPLSTFSEMKSHLCKPLAQLFFTSSLYFKCSVLESLRELLLNWLNWHVMQADMATELNADLLNTTLSGLVSSVAELIHLVGRLSTSALCLENNSTFLMHFILDFYEIVCDVYLKYNLPLVVMPPAGVFYPALLSMDSVTLDQLCHIMYRYRTNLVAAKQNQQAKKTMLQFKFSSRTCQEYNRYLTAMVGCLWTSNVFQKDFHPQGIKMDPEVLEKAKLQEYWKSLNIVFHPALTGYAVLFLEQAQNDGKPPNFKLIQGKRWEWYLEYMYSQELQGLKLFIKSSINRVSRHPQTKASK
ncbi:centromere protein I [Hemicordylus capensis]|uniref:centromere protein I n=1 Tax=Hemicordylus capensis TaxID=884348 RepID=UPI002303A95E|nr:centromere protein I [Hemicordylus capensis]XP_053130302.1 centromere protein I [Hemicordylus capensis]XP_053130303.1 centromere protein I [Hemicordylus capensis]XP_053130305.1 centromere protein I [Hemicordylus capensis]